MADTINLLLQVNDESEDATRGLQAGEEAVDADGRIISGMIRDVAAPTASDDGFPVGTTWINTSTERVYTCTSNAAGAAVWKQEINAVTGGGVEALGGITLDTLGSTTDLAIAYPLVDGVIDAASHTDANRIGWFAHRGAGGGFGGGINSGGLIGAVVLGNLILEIGDNKVATNGDLTCGDDIIALDEIRARSGGSATDPKFAFHDNDGTYDPLTLQVGWWFDDVSNFIGTTVNGTHVVSTFADRVEIEPATASTLPTNGALVVAGGVGVGGQLTVGGVLYLGLNTTVNGGSYSVENFDDTWWHVAGDVYSATDWHATYYIGRRARGTSASPANVQAGDILAGFEGKAWVNGAFREGPEWVAYCDTTPPGTGSTFNSRWDCTVNMESLGQRIIQRLSPTETLINVDALDHDFVINKNTSGEAVRYDAGLDTLTIGCTTSFDGPIAATMPSYNRGWMAYSSGNGALWGNDSNNVTLTGVTSGATATVIGSSGTSSGRLDLSSVSVGTDFIDGETVNISGGGKDGTTIVVDSFQREVQQIQVAVADAHDVIAFGMVPDFLDLTILGGAGLEGFGNFVFFCGQNDDFDIISPSFNADLVIEREFDGRRDFTKQVRIGWEGIFGQIHSHDTIRLSFDPNGSTEFPRVVNFTDATAATSSTTGAVTIPNGGLGVGGDVHSGGNFEAVNRVIAGGDVIAGDDVTLADELRLGSSGAQRASSFKVNAAVPAFAGNADTDGFDTYWRTQTGGAHSVNNPRGGDIIVNFGVGGSGGTGRDGRFDIQGVLLKRSQVEVVATSTTLTAESSKKVRQSAGGITTTLWASPVDGDEIWIRHASGGAANTLAGNGKNIEGAANFSLADGESVFLVFDATLNEWVVY